MVNILSILRKKIKLRKNVMLAAGYAVLVIILGILTYLTYDDYQKTIITQQQQNMLGISRAISRSMQLFVDDIKDSMKIVTLDKEVIDNIQHIEHGKMIELYNEKFKHYYDAEKSSINNVCLVDKSGKILIQYPEGIDDSNKNIKTEIDTAIKNKETYIGMTYWNKNRESFIFNIYEPVFNGNEFEGLIFVTLSLNTIYDRLIAPVKIGEKGYAMVKDQYGTIIMHIVKEQVGMDVIDTRKQVFPNLEYGELEGLIKEQLTGKEGYAMYHSYWWGDDVLKKIKKLNAYSPVQLGKHFWIVAVVMSYDEIQGPINEFLWKIVGIDILIICIVYIFTSTLIKMRKNKEELEKETEYLKTLNETSEQLRKKEAELYHSHKLKIIGTLAGGIAHDINNLLTPILGYSELLLMRIPKGSEYYEDIEEILKASQKGKDLVEQILIFSRNDNGVTKVELVDVNKAMKETLKLFKSVLPKNVIVKEDIEKNCGFISANYTQIHQVIFNLCTNAYQAIKNDDGLINISLNTVYGDKINSIGKVILENKKYIELIVKDTGCGMDEETKTRIFDPFFTTKAAGEGTGLGLFVVQSIIGKYGGSIAVESEPGIGSCFKVYLPLADMEINPKDGNAIQDISNINKKILIVDDNEENIKMLKKGLEHLGYEVVAEKNSLQAIRIFEINHDKFDFVITDYVMPELNGGELAAEIKKIRKDTVVILMTGFMDENKKDINELKFIDAYISKPIEFVKLSQLLKMMDK